MRQTAGFSETSPARGKEDLIARLSQTYLVALREGDPAAARQAVNTAQQAQVDILEIYLDVILPAQRKMGSLWAAGDLDIWEEHLATEITISEMTRLREQIVPRPPLGVTVLVTTLEGDRHVLGARVIADFFYRDGWEVDFLGSETPNSEIVDLVSRRIPDLIAISVSNRDQLTLLQALALELRKLASPPVILAGGRAFDHSKEDALKWGVDLMSSSPRRAIVEARKHCGITRSEQELGQTLRLLGRRIQAGRKKKGLSQGQLASAAEIDRAYLSTLENGKKNMSVGVLLKLAAALDIRLEDLFL